MRVLFCGETAGGSAVYLLSLLQALRARVRHVPSSARLTLRAARERYDVAVFSDFPAAHAAAAVQRELAGRAWAGELGLLMIGGWGSFAAPDGRWIGTPIAEALPVVCGRRDDRVNWPGGAVVVPAAVHGLLAGLTRRPLPVICGFNRVTVRPRGQVVLDAQPLVSRVDRAGRLTLGARAPRAPLLVLDADPCRRIAALTTDLAPHWCGGLVDWGARRVRLRAGRTQVEVGDRYVALALRLMRWLARTRCSC